MTAERQMWVEAGRRECDRVKRLHAKAKSEGKTSSSTYSRERATKPWTWSRIGPGPLYDFDDQMIQSVHVFDYDLKDEGFVGFLKDAAQLHICRAKGSDFWNMLDLKEVSYDQFIQKDGIRRAQEFEGRRYEYSPAELEGFWRMFIRTRVYLQGAYDTYLERETEPLDHVKMASEIGL